jgi:hypothetical protein
MRKNCQHRDDGRGQCIDCGAFLDTWEDSDTPTFNLSATEQTRVNAGLQCPECFGVRVDCSDCGPSPRQYLCEECGEQWDCYRYDSLLASYGHVIAE